ncbi:biotin--[acetyl-CoA-carboxylase] ligase [Flagellimonas onchidii]|uniref:biotin--[acetyl-CoA-carboxylase] ligase n=1 Tax=Flagellimonas onchidii TaxID=2562684 RepID=UPI0010A662B6|nr:biotin--[acetyl-CoA-carboxylase] ligase [Allomuricauda onchidii]
MNRESLSLGLRTKKFGRNIIYFDVIGSTNEEAKKAIQKEVLPEGTVYISARQTAGKGTNNNTWISNNIEGLLFSLVIDFDEKIDQFIMFLPAISLVNVLKREYDIKAHVKWPNDVLIGNKKVCGILCEGIAQKQLIIGVGVNVNHNSFPDAIKSKAISIFQATGKRQRIENLFQSLMYEMESIFYEKKDLRSEWLKKTKMIGKKITAKKRGIEISVEVVGISKEGYLIVQNSDGEKEEWRSSTHLDIYSSYA